MSEPARAAVTLPGGPVKEIWPGLAGLLTRVSGQPVLRCYQCHKCSSGCPAAEYMDYAPSQIVRLITFGLARELLTSRAIWACTGCLTCGLRCPNGINIGAVNDTLKGWLLSNSLPAAVTEEIGQEQVKTGDRKAALFHRLFLGSLRYLGRMHELALMGGYKVFSGDLMSDLPAGFKMMAQGKLPLLPRLGPERREVAAMFVRAPIVSRRRLKPVRHVDQLERGGRGR